MNIFNKPPNKNYNEKIYSTDKGECWSGDSLKLMKNIKNSSVDLIFTSPPYALLKQKEYGNVSQKEYVKWFRGFADEFFRVLKDSGSLVINIGSSWIKGKPIKSLYHYELLIDLCQNPNEPEKKFNLCQELFWNNPAKMPLPVQWVNVKRERIKETVENIFWLSKTEHPKSNNKEVLTPYKSDMKKLLKTQKYNQGKRPSGSIVTDKWGKNNGGAIPSNLLNVSNTGVDDFRKKLIKKGYNQHPAIFPSELPKFFIKMCTNKNDLVLDPFAGSNMTGFVAEKEGRKWISIEKKRVYCRHSKLRFNDLT